MTARETCQKMHEEYKKYGYSGAKLLFHKKLSEYIAMQVITCVSEKDTHEKNLFVTYVAVLYDGSRGIIEVPTNYRVKKITKSPYCGVSGLEHSLSVLNERSKKIQKAFWIIETTGDYYEKAILDNIKKIEDGYNNITLYAADDISCSVSTYGHSISRKSNEHDLKTRNYKENIFKI